MIYTDCTITVKGNKSSIDNTIYLYRGDKEVQIYFTIQNNRYKYANGSAENLIQTTEASFGQLIIKRPETTPIFTEIAPTSNGRILLTITGDMIDELVELGAYDFQIRLFDENKQSRITIPPVIGGIVIEEPIAIEDVTITNEVNVAQVNNAVVTADTALDVFDEQGNYIKTEWNDKDVITDAKLNKIEQGIEGVNQKIDTINNSGVTINDDTTSVSTTQTYSNSKIEDRLTEVGVDITAVVDDLDSMDVRVNYLEGEQSKISAFDGSYGSLTGKPTGLATETFVTNAINNAQLGGGSVDLSGYAPLNSPDFTGDISLGRKANTTVGDKSVAIGDNVTASGAKSFAVGESTTASGENSHAEGRLNTASGYNSHAEGLNNRATNSASHAEGANTLASGIISHAEGNQTTASGEASHAEGYNTKASGKYSHAEGQNTNASGELSHAEGLITTANNYYSHAEGCNTTASGAVSHAECDSTTASGEGSHAEGRSTTALGNYSHAEGSATYMAIGKVTNLSTSTANSDIITAWNSNNFSLAKGESSHVEGKDNLALGKYSHAEGWRCIVYNEGHAEGCECIAGNENITSFGYGYHAEGYKCVASGTCSHAEGLRTIASGENQHVQGRLNLEDTENKYAHIVGNGSLASGERSNAHTLDWNGNAWYAGKLSQEGEPTKSNDLVTLGFFRGGYYPIVDFSDGTFKITENDIEVIGNTTFTLTNGILRITANDASGTKQGIKIKKAIGIPNTECICRITMAIKDYLGTAEDFNMLWTDVKLSENHYNRFGNINNGDYYYYRFNIVSGIGTDYSHFDITSKNPFDIEINEFDLYYKPNFIGLDVLNNMFSFNEAGELVVTIGGVSKTFVPKSE